MLAHQFAMENPLIQAEAVEAMEFSDLANRYRVSGVPHTVINNGKGHLIGAVPETNLLAEIQRIVSD